MSDEKPLSGTFKVSFNVNLSMKDSMFLADIAQAITEGFNDSPVLSKLANLDIEDVTPPAVVRPGDLVTFKDTLKVRAHVFEDKGSFVLKDSMYGDLRDLGEFEVILSGQHQATVNCITKEGVELIDFNTAVDIPLRDPDTDEIEETPAYITSLTVSPLAIAKVEE